MAKKFMCKKCKTTLIYDPNKDNHEQKVLSMPLKLTGHRSFRECILNKGLSIKELETQTDELKIEEL